MTDKILARYILEGMLHNINNHMNLILGYSQTLQKNHPELKEAHKIYKAGIHIDDTLKDLSRQLWERSFAFYEEMDLSSWVKKELSYLQHYLPIKHHLTLEHEDLASDQVIFIAHLDLALWYESRLLLLTGISDSLHLKTGVALYNDKPALYLRFDQNLDQEQITALSAEPVCELIGQRQFPITSLWDPQTFTLYGVVNEG